MVLTAGKGGAGAAGAPRPLPTGRPGADRERGIDGQRGSEGQRGSHGQRGSQTLEFALVLPLVTLLVVLGLHGGLLAADLVAVQGLAREAARAAAVGDDTTTRTALARAAGGQAVRVTLHPPSPRRPGTLVTAEVTLESRALRAFGQHVWVPGRAVMRVEDR